MPKPDLKTALVAVLAAISCAQTANAAESSRIEYRYPDRPDIVYSNDGQVRQTTDNRPMAFSNFQSAISVADARSIMGETGFVSETPTRIAPRPEKPVPMPLYPVQTAAAQPAYTQPAPVYEPAYEPVYEVATPSDYVIQAGAFGNYSNASRLADQLSAFGETRITSGQSNGKPVHRVQLGGWSSKSQAQPMLDLIRARGFDGFVAKGG